MIRPRRKTAKAANLGALFRVELGAGVAALYAAGAYGWALAFALVCPASRGLAVAWDQ
ncbi:hypothetical protein ABZ079_04130 [Streptomyces sp. NPDC006314]|uniref:hypothetical protein n=1 Tax=Streptomyces sp. NPDC006314 TaxID=3154475 RepID=UPI0033AA5BB5